VAPASVHLTLAVSCPVLSFATPLARHARIPPQVLAERLRRKRREHLGNCRSFSAEMKEWRDKVHREILFRSAMTQWFEIIGVDPSLENLNLCRDALDGSAPPSPDPAPDSLRAQGALAADSKDDEMAGDRAGTAPGSPHEELEPEPLGDKASVSGGKRRGRRVPRPPMMPRFSTMPSEERMSSLLTACIKKCGHLKLRRAIMPELKKSPIMPLLGSEGQKTSPTVGIMFTPLNSDKKLPPSGTVMSPMPFYRLSSLDK
jgi:hypothetical protein